MVPGDGRLAADELDATEQMAMPFGISRQADRLLDVVDQIRVVRFEDESMAYSRSFV